MASLKQQEELYRLMRQKQTLVGHGYDMNGDHRDNVPIILPDSDRKGHFWCFGTTRVGKTRLIENMLEQDLKKGYSVVIIDPKGDGELFSKVAWIAEMTDREDELMLVTPIFPELSARFNPLSNFYMAEELVGTIVSSVETGKEKFFYNVAYEVSLVIVQALILLQVAEGGPARGRFNYNLNNIKYWMSQAKLKELKDRVQDLTSPEAKQLVEDMNKICDSPQDYYGKVSSSLRVALMELTSGNIGQVIGTVSGNAFMERLESGDRVILVVQLGSLLTRKAAFTVGKVVVSMIQAFVGRRFASNALVDPPLCLYIDEAQNVLYLGIEDLFAKAGGANVWVHGFAQSVNQLYAAVGKENGNAILDNTNTKLFMRVPDTDTSKYAARHFGVYRRYAPVLNMGGGASVRETEEPRVKEEDLLQLQPREFYMMTYRGNYKAKTADVSALPLIITYPEIRT